MKSTPKSAWGLPEGLVDKFVVKEVALQTDPDGFRCPISDGQKCALLLASKPGGASLTSAAQTQDFDKE